MSGVRNRPGEVLFAKEDMISKLLDSLINQILMFLTTMEAVRTSVLSKRWKHCWLLLSVIDVDTGDFYDYNSFLSFTEKFIYSAEKQKTGLHKFILSNSKDKTEFSCCVKRWIDFVGTPNIEHLSVKLSHVTPEYLESVPLSLYFCEKLEYLSLARVCLPGLEHGCKLLLLRTLALEANIYANESVVKTLILSCPKLEDLSIWRCANDNAKDLNVQSKSVKKIIIGLSLLNDGDELFNDEISRVIIDVPSLEVLLIEEDTSCYKSITITKSLSKVELFGAFYIHGVETTREFFRGISGVRDMNIASSTFELMKEVGLLPQFCNLSCLELQHYYCALNFLPTFISYCPNLKKLKLELLTTSVYERVRLSLVPQCLLTSLEFVTIRSYYFGEVERKVAAYFAQESTILEELSLIGETSMTVRRSFFKLKTKSPNCLLSIYSLQARFSN